MLKKIITLIAAQNYLNPENLSLQTTLANDLDMDDQDLYQLQIGLEDLLRMPVPKSELFAFETIGDILLFSQNRSKKMYSSQ